MDDAEWVSTWKEHASAFDRVRAVVMATDEPHSATWIADHARVAESTAREHLERLSEMGVVTPSDERTGTVYGPDPAYVRFREIRELTTEYDPEELGELVVDLKEAVETLQETYDSRVPHELREAAAAEEVSAEKSRELLRTASELEHYVYRLSLLEDAIARYDEFQMGHPTPA